MSSNSPLSQAMIQAIEASNQQLLERHKKTLAFQCEQLEADGCTPQAVIDDLVKFDVACPSWALGAGGTRFGRFSVVGEPTCLEEKMEDIVNLRRLMGTTKSIAMHIPWDKPQDPAAIRQIAQEGGLTFAAMNSNTFQDQAGQKLSYKFGSLTHTDAAVRQQAIDHNLECVEIGKELGSKELSIWIGDGGNHPGQQHMRGAMDRMIDSMQKIYAGLPDDWLVYTEHKPFEPAFYSTVVCDWGASLMIAGEVGERCRCLVDLGHHLQGCNIEQVVAYLLRAEKLGGFHFNDAKYADDDLTAGSLRPYMLFLIFTELVQGELDAACKNPSWCYMIDESHNVKDPIEDLCQATEAIQRARAQALLVDYKALHAAQEANDAVMASELLQRAFRTDVTPLIREARLRQGSAIDPLGAYRQAGYRKLAGQTRKAGVAAGL